MPKLGTEGWNPLLPDDRRKLLAEATEAHAHGDMFAKWRGVVPEAAPSESATEHARAPEEDAPLPVEDMVGASASALRGYASATNSG